MATYYVAPGSGRGDGRGPGDDAAAADLSQIPWQPGLTVLVRRGTRLYLPPLNGRAGLFIHPRDGLRFSHYGDSAEPPILHGAVTYRDGWVHSGQRIFTRTGPETSGVVLYQDEPLPFFDAAAPGARELLADSAAGGYMIGSGGSAPQISVKLPGDAEPSAGGVAISSTMIGIECSHATTVSDLEIDGLELMGFSRQGINLRNVIHSSFRNNVVHATGGDRTNAWYVGGCIQCTAGCDGLEFYHNHVYDCFDSPFSPQIPAGDDGAMIQNITYRENMIGGGWALAGVEVTSWASYGTLRNITIENNRIENGGTGFSGMGDGPRGPLGIIVNANRTPSPTNRFENIVIRGNHIGNCPSGGIYFEHVNAVGCVVEANTITHCGAAGPRGRAGAGTVQTRGGIDISTPEALQQEIDIVSNEIDHCEPHGIVFDSPGALSSGSIVNNTLVNNGDCSILLRGNTTLPELRNNICYGAGILKHGSAFLGEDYNSVYHASTPFSGFSPGPHTTQAPPGLVDPGKGDYQLRDVSPLIGAGHQPQPTDRLGRRFETADIGCYAYRSGSEVECLDLERLTRA